MADAPPPPYEEGKMYPNPSAGAPHYSTGAPSNYQPNMNNPYPPSSAPPPQFAPHAHQQQHHQHPHPQDVNQTYVYVNEAPHFGSRPTNVSCPHCHQQVISKVRYSAGLLAWILFGLFLLFGCWLGCCLIPFCMESCQDCEHYCSNCNGFLGHHKRL